MISHTCQQVSSLLSNDYFTVQETDAIGSGDIPQSRGRSCGKKTTSRALTVTHATPVTLVRPFPLSRPDSNSGGAESVRSGSGDHRETPEAPDNTIGSQYARAVGRVHRKREYLAQGVQRCEDPRLPGHADRSRGPPD